MAKYSITDYRWINNLTPQRELLMLTASLGALWVIWYIFTDTFSTTPNNSLPK